MTESEIDPFDVASEASALLEADGFRFELVDADGGPFTEAGFAIDAATGALTLPTNDDRTIHVRVTAADGESWVETLVRSRPTLLVEPEAESAAEDDGWIDLLVADAGLGERALPAHFITLTMQAAQASAGFDRIAAAAGGPDVIPELWPVAVRAAGHALSYSSFHPASHALGLAWVD
jgi:NAD(P)-dependent dehydrogenase (short-subunit alcohol dehydrogenase family)